MTKAALLAIALFACGGKAKPANPPPETQEHATAEEAKPVEKPVEKPAEVAPAEAKPDEGALAQAALAEQYEAGKKVFKDKKCASCHGDDGKGKPKNPPVMGDKALPEAAPKTAKLRKGIKFQTAKDVLDFVKAKMPLKGPGTLSDDEAAAVTSWILSENKVAIDKKLDASNAGDVKLR